MARILSGLLALSLTTTGVHILLAPAPPPVPALTEPAPACSAGSARRPGSQRPGLRRRRRIPHPRCHLD